MVADVNSSRHSRHYKSPRFLFSVQWYMFLSQQDLLLTNWFQNLPQQQLEYKVVSHRPTKHLWYENNLTPHTVYLERMETCPSLTGQLHCMSQSLPCLLLAFHLFPFPLCPPLLLSAQSINLQWSGCLTAAPPEEYQSMLLWRPDQTPLFYFPPLVLHVAVPKLNMIQTLSVNGSLSSMCRYETVI